MLLAWILVFLTAETRAAEPQQRGDDHNWSYDGSPGVGPQAWASLAHHALGLRQSPIKIPVRNPNELTAANLPVKYGRVPLEMFHNNGHTWKGTFKGYGGTLTLAGKEYHLIQFHLHAPSEHALLPRTEEEKQLAISLGATESVVFASGLRSDFHFPMELHMVHKSADDKLAVIGVFVVPGEQGYPQDGSFMVRCNEFIREDGALWHARTDDGPYKIDMASFLPKMDAYQWYDGSLTTPPCSESVRWIVMCQPIKFHGAWIKMFKDSMSLAGNPYTDRPVQHPYGRRVTTVSGDDRHSPPVGNIAGAFAGTWQGTAGAIIVKEALTILWHNDEVDYYGFAGHQGEELHVSYLNGDADVLKLLDEKSEFDDLLHSQQAGNLKPLGEVAGFVGEWIDAEADMLTIEEGISVQWNHMIDGVQRQDRYVGEIRGNRLTMKQDDETVVFRLDDGVLRHSKYGDFSK